MARIDELREQAKLLLESCVMEILVEDIREGKAYSIDLDIKLKFEAGKDVEMLAEKKVIYGFKPKFSEVVEETEPEMKCSEE